MTATPTLAQTDVELAEFISQFYDDPLGFVLAAYPWGEAGPLEHEELEDWQREVLTEIGNDVKARAFDGQNAVEAIRQAIASGHGIGKSTLIAWIADWIMSTRPFAQGTVTANTVTQLETKTWPAIEKWTKLCITGHWFTTSGGAMRHRSHPKQWFLVAQTCREENSEAFAGQHAATSSSFYLNDEASAIPDIVWDVEEGGLTDGEPMIFAFGNPTKSSGRFYEICFGSKKERWRHRSIDSRLVRRTNKQQIEQWIEDYGDDSDFVRVRVKGIPPRASELQYIDQDRVSKAQRREAESLNDDPLVYGVDVSGGGSAWTVAFPRRGNDARSIPRMRLTGEQSRDRNIVVAKLADILSDPRRPVAAMFIDSAFGAAICERLWALGYKQVVEVSFGGESPDLHFANQRAYMWSKKKDWLEHGAIPKEIELEQQITGPGYHINRQNKLVLESKQEMQKRGLASPDDGDALALTFAQPVAIPKPKKRPSPPVHVGPWS